MVETAAHLTDDVLPPLPVRQWVLSLPKRLRPFLHRNPAIAGAVLCIFPDHHLPDSGPAPIGFRGRGYPLHSPSHYRLGLPPRI